MLHLALFRTTLKVLSFAKRSFAKMANFDLKLNGKNAVVQINRPKALNALNIEMIKELYAFLRTSEVLRSLIVIKGNERAFCSGGDVKLIANHSEPGYGQEFFRLEYLMNYVVATYGLPYVALIDGIVMGGGVGISLHGTFRVATEHTVFAMPETLIGFFPDVGTCHPLSRMRNHLGYYLATTGARLHGLDVVKAGIATHFCERKNLANLETELIDLTTPTEEKIRTILDKYNNIPKDYEFSLNPVLKNINEAFNAKTVEHIFTNLQRDNSEWALKTLETLKKMSPTSLKITFKELNLAKNINDMKMILEMDYRIAFRLIAHSDFKEGVRACLIDKTNNPKWEPATLEEVQDDFVDSFFEKLPADQELQSK